MDAPSDNSTPNAEAQAAAPHIPPGPNGESVDASDKPVTNAAPIPNLISQEAPAVPGQTFSDIEELKNHLQDWAGDHGFAISCTSSKGGDYYTMRCKRARGGNGGCPWTMVVRRFFFLIDNNRDGRLVWTTTNFTHNHPPMPRGTFAIHRRPTPEVREFIERAGERGDKPRVILNIVRRMEGCAEFDIDTVYYIVAQWRRKSRGDGASSGMGTTAVEGTSHNENEKEPVEQAPNHHASTVSAARDTSENATNGEIDNSKNGSSTSPDTPAEIDPMLTDEPKLDQPQSHSACAMPEAQSERVDARGRPKPWCDGCQSYIRHHGSCPREQRKRKAAGESTVTYVDMGVQTEPLDIFKDPAFARQIAAILLTASENVKSRAGL
ncbi:uncharacterized protein CcaverHIS019_0100190 [Cutaneotrichosporon cavernicola]|uniref:Uncharacterized protein n=1 Tax=Cutaneotrichosporon cavernicola TaxID=279322 RepID=A0AA48IAN5_9TREE|nr:uncharacterized protein CcaverHIS019_0100190 [Cutaneotrichosporon cavernicola]BEI87301.1 hypothetical protein CcaverHIS019_0100190 [Cutaneotrichosporon cavernicola]BEI95071.1 hypothetical protein CcaverHIS631_0100200 [Cutaneotrichosporon cavernicola]